LLLSNLKWVALDALDINAALIDRLGKIVEVNEAWRSFAEANGATPSGWVGVNYFSVCDRTAGIDSVCAAEIAAGIRSVLVA
jgi:hypothetical protein